MNSILSIPVSLALRLVVDLVSQHDSRISGTVVGIWEGVVLHYSLTNSSTFDACVAYGMRLLFDVFISPDIVKVFLIVLWTLAGGLVAEALLGSYDNSHFTTRARDHRPKSTARTTPHHIRYYEVSPTPPRPRSPQPLHILPPPASSPPRPILMRAHTSNLSKPVLPRLTDNPMETETERELFAAHSPSSMADGTWPLHSGAIEYASYSGPNIPDRSTDIHSPALRTDQVQESDTLSIPVQRESTLAANNPAIAVSLLPAASVADEGLVSSHPGQNDDHTPRALPSDLPPLSIPEHNTLDNSHGVYDNKSVFLPAIISEPIQPVMLAIPAMPTSDGFFAFRQPLTRSILPELDATDGVASVLSPDRLSLVESVLTQTDAASAISAREAISALRRAEYWRQRARDEEDASHAIDTKYRLAKRRGNTREGFLLALDARKSAERVTKLHAKAARRFYHAHNDLKTHPPHTIDVHGLRGHEALRMTEIAIRNTLLKGGRRLRVIVGKGIHSKGKQAVLKPLIVKEMERQNIPVKVDISNTGVLIITFPREEISL